MSTVLLFSVFRWILRPHSLILFDPSNYKNFNKGKNRRISHLSGRYLQGDLRWLCLLMNWYEMSNLYREPSIDASYQVSVHLAQRFQRRIFFFRNWPTRNKNFRWWLCLLTDREEMSNVYRGCSIRCFLPSFGSFGKAVSEEKIFRNRPIRIKNCLWQPCWFMDRNEMSNLNRGPSIEASYQVSVYLTERFQRSRFFRNWPTSNKNFLWRPCLLTDRNEIRSFNRGPSIDASYHVSFNLAKLFQRMTDA